MANAEYTVSYYDNRDASGTPKATWVFKTDEGGRLRYSNRWKVSGPDLYTDQSGLASLPIGSITIQETKAPVGYLLDDTVYTVVFKTDESGNVGAFDTDGNSIQTINASNEADLNVVSPEKLIYGGVKVVKRDAETKGEAQSDASLKGAEVTITYEGEKDITIGDETYHTGDTVLTLTTDENGYAESAADALPCGTYSASESYASPGYTLNTGWRVNFQIREQGKIIDLGTTDDMVEQGSDQSGWFTAKSFISGDATLYEAVIRGNFTLSKVDEDGTPMANIPFLVERLDENGKAVESHVIVTDENGVINTAERPMSGDKVNCLDEYVSGHTFTDESKLDGTTGIWFGAPASEISGKGSLVYGTYRITELKCKANDGKDLLTTTIFEGASIKTFTDGVNIPVIMPNLDIDVTSALLETAKNSQSADYFEKDSIVLNDTIHFTHLKTTTRYKVVATFYYVDRNGSVTELGSNYTTFNPASKTGKATTDADVSVIVSVPTEGMDGGKICASDTIYRVQDGIETPLASHNTDLSEGSQTVYLPYLSTTAVDGYTGDHVGTVTEDAAITDTVAFEGLRDGELYTFEGTLRYADTGEVVKDKDGKDCVVTLTYKCDWNDSEVTQKDDSAFGPKDGTVEMPAFKFDASELGGRSLVVTEKLYDSENETVYDHNDLTDEDQTVDYPEIRTTATDAATGDHNGHLGEQITIVDKVAYTGLLAGKEYTVKGTLMNKETGKELLVNGRTVTAEKQFTADKSEGSVEIEFTFDSTALAGTTVVAFENVYYNDVLVAVHTDLSDEDQSVNFPALPTTTTIVHTGDTAHPAVWGTFGTLAGLLAVVTARKFRKRQKSEK